MGKGANFNIQESSSKDESKQETLYSWSEIKDNKKWIVIDGKVYDVSKFSKRHPGGERLMMNHVGQDASDAFTAFHNDMKKVTKYMKPLEIGKLHPDEASHRDQEILNDFKNLRLLAEKMNLFKSDATFYILSLFHIIALDLLGWLLIFYSGYSNWFTYLFAVAMLVTAQAQAGWNQHDYGHLSVFKNNKLNHFVQRIVIGTIKGVSADWWNYRHFQHHAKPNTIRKDPDIRFGSLFVLGKILPKELGEKKKGSFPYHLQQNYFFMILPPLLLPIYFNIENVYYLYKKKKFTEFAWLFSFVLKWGLCYCPVLGLLGAIKLYFLVRFIESHWFVWTTQMSHLPMNIDRDQELSWFRSQLMATCNVEQSFFNDWFSGHLNFQIEHHLFPTMPRNNYHKIAPYVKSMCEKHKIEYQMKTLGKAMADIYHCLKESGELWYEAYHM